MSTKSRSRTTVTLAALVLLAATVLFADVSFIGVDTTAHLVANNTGAIVTGSLVCDPGYTFNVNGIITQNHGKTNITGATLDSPDTDCLGVPQPFSASVYVLIPPNGAFKKGPASLILSVYTSDGGGQTVTAKLHLSN